MLEPYNRSDQEHSKVKVDHDVLASMMKSWLVPRTTGILYLSEKREPGKENSSLLTKNSENNIKI